MWYDLRPKLYSLTRRRWSYRFKDEIPGFEFTSKTVGRIGKKFADFADQAGRGAAKDHFAIVERPALLKLPYQIGYQLRAGINETLFPPRA